MSFSIEDIPKIAPVTEDFAVTESPGIPQSSAPPAGMIGAMGGFAQSAPDDLQRDFDRRMREWRSKGESRIDTAVLDPDKAFKDVDMSFSSDKVKAQRGAIVDAWMELNHDEPVAPTELQRKSQFQIASFAKFGELASSEDEIYPLIEKDSTRRRDVKALTSGLLETARISATVGEFGEAGAKFGEWAATAKTKPGYDKDFEADYYQAWQEAKFKSKDAVAPYKEELGEVWKAMKAGGAGSPSEVIKSIGADLLLGGGADGEDTIDELQKKDAGAVAYDAYAKLSESERPAFLDGLSVLIKQFPKEQRPALLATWGKEFGGTVDSFGRGAVSRFTADGMQQWIDKEAAKTRGPWAATDEEKARGKIRTDEALKRKNFMDAVRKMERDEYAPTPFYSDASEDILSARMLEKGFYGSASAVASMAVMATPYAGYPVLALAMEDFAYQDLRDNAMRAGASEIEASRFANENKTIAAVPQLGLEILQDNLALGKLPAVNKVLIKLGDKITNRLVRFGVKAAAVTGAETGVEEIQYQIPYAVQELSHALEADTGIPATVWSNGKNGALDGFWNRQISTFLSMLPLGGAAALGGMNKEARNAAFARASTTQLQAAGATPEAIAGVRGATGPASLNEAVETLMIGRDPNSEDVKAPVLAIEQEAEDQKAASERLNRSGYIPTIVGNAQDGYSVLDGETREIVATAPDWQGAMKISETHSAQLDEKNAEMVAYVGSLLELGEEALAMSGDTNARTSLEVGTEYTQFLAAAENPGAIDQFAQQAQDLETLSAGNAGVTFAALGQNVQETRGLVRTFTNRLFQGASALTAVHETGHAMLDRAWDRGAITRQDTEQFVRAFHEIWKGKQVRVSGTKDGANLKMNRGLLADGQTVEAMSDGDLKERVMWVIEEEVLRNRKKSKDQKALPISGTLVSRNLLALARLAPGATKKFMALIRSVRGVMGLASARALATRKAIREGKITEAEIDAFMAKLTGRDYQAEHDGIVRDEAVAIVGETEVDENNPFSLGRATVTPTKETKVFQGAEGSPSVIGPAAFSIGAFSIGAHHGTPHKVDKFSTDKIGTGEGAQAYGWGLYFADSEKVARNYRDNLSGNYKRTGGFANPWMDPRPFGSGWIVEKNDGRGNATFPSKKKALEFKAAKDLEIQKANDTTPLGNLYTVTLDVNDEDLLDWDKPLSEQSEKVQKAIAGVREFYQRGNTLDGDIRGGQFYTIFEVLAGKGASTSAELNSAGIPGIRYLDGNSRGEGEGSYNYVIFDESKIKITEENGTPVDSPFSLAPSAFIGSLAMNAASRIKDPKEKLSMFTRMVAKLSELKQDRDEVVKAFGGEFTRGAIENPRKKASIRKERNFLEASRRAELEDEAHAKHGGILHSEDLDKLKAQPVHGHLADPTTNLRGRLMSEAAATARGQNFFDPKKQGDFDGSGDVSRSVFGGSLMPDRAAQELFRAGLIAFPTPDSMWEALKREAKSVEKVKEYMKAARKDLKAARLQAKEEATQWEEQRLKEEAKNYNPRERLLRALAMMDAIISVLPVSERGRIGGYTQLAKLGSDEKRLKFLNDRIDKVDEVVEDYLTKQYSKMMEKLLARAKPSKEGGKKPKGKLGAEGHRYFAAVDKMMGMSFSEVEAYEVKLDQRIAEADIENTELLADLWEESQVLTYFGHFKGKTAEAMAEAVEHAQEVYDTNRNKRRTLEEARLGGMKGLLRSGLESLGLNRPGDAIRGTRAANKLGSKIKGGKYSFSAFNGVIEAAFGEDAELTKRWSRSAREGFSKRTAAIIKAHKRWTAATEAATGLKGRQARLKVWEMANKATVKGTLITQTKETLRVPIDTFFDAEKRAALGFTDAEVAQLTEQFEALPDKSKVSYLAFDRMKSGEADVVDMTEAQAIYFSMLWAQDGYKAGMRMHGLGEDFQAEIESGLSDAAKEIRMHLAKEYTENYEPLRAMFAKMYGVNLPQTENYTPGRFYSQGDAAGGMDVTGSGFVEGGFKQGFLKDRKKHTAKPKAENAFGVYFNHLNQTEHWKALAEFSRELHGVLGNPKMKEALQARNPDIARELANWLQNIDGNGMNNPPDSALLSFIMTSQAYLAMAYKASTLAKNFFGSAINSMFKLPVTEVLKGYGRMMRGEIDFAPIWNSEFMQNRLHGGFSPEVRAAAGRALGGKPTLRGDLLLKGMEYIGTADAYGTACGAAICYDIEYRKAKVAGMTDEVAHAVALDSAADLVSRTSQPVEIIDRSLMEQRLSGIGRMSFIFASEARQKSALYVEAWSRMLTAKPTIKDIRVLVISHFVVAPIMHAITMFFRDIRDDDDDEWLDEKYWNLKDFSVAMAMGPVSGVPYLREAVMHFSGDRGPLTALWNSGASAIDLLFEEPRGDELEWYEKKITKVFEGISPTTAVGASIFDQIFDVARNFMDDD